MRNTRYTFTWFFAVLYLTTVTGMVSGGLPDPYYSLIWPPAGIAVWWAVKCRNRTELAFVYFFVFATGVLVFHFIEHMPTETVWIAGFAQLLAGPAVRHFMAGIDNIRMSGTWVEARHRSPLDQIAYPSDVYRLLVASILAVAVSKLVSLVRISLEGGDVTMAVFTSLFLRDLAGILWFAGPGLAVFSSTRNLVSKIPVREQVALVLVTTVLLLLVFSPIHFLPIAYLVMLPLYWSATRLTVSMAAIHAFVTVTISMFLGYWFGNLPFASSYDPLSQAVAIRLFVILCILLSLVVSTTVQQRSALITDLEAVISTIPDALITVDKSGIATPVNEAAQSVIATADDGTLVKRPLKKVGGGILADDASPSSRALAGEQVKLAMVELADAAGDEGLHRIYAVSSSPLYGSDRKSPDRALLLYHDTTEEYRAVEQAKSAHEQTRALFDFAPQGIATLDEAGLIIQANQAFGSLVGLDPKGISGKRLDDFASGDQISRLLSAALAHPSDLFHLDQLVTTACGEEKMVAFSFRTVGFESNASVPTVLVNAVDITERQILHELVTHMADHDALTGLINRRAFDREMSALLERSFKEDLECALLLIDLDHFKSVNDTFGHFAGDRLLVELAALLKDSAPNAHLIARLGGDEFVIVLKNADRLTAEELATRILQSARTRLRGRGEEFDAVTASIGIATLSDAASQGKDPLYLADRLLYDAKHLGRDQFATLDSSRTPKSLTEIPDEATYILETGSFDLELQPIMEISTGNVVAAEGLIRFNLPVVGLSVWDFVTAVERSGRASELDAMVLKKGIALIPELQKVCPGFKVSLNISAHSLVGEHMSLFVLNELRRHNVPPNSLVLEVTESVPIEDLQSARIFQQTMKANGVSMAIDDFGSGIHHYRSLKDIEFDVVKIDGEFIEGSSAGGVDLGILESIVALAKTQQMTTVAEYVSDESVFEVVKNAGVNFAQGYFIGASLPLAQFVEIHLVEAEKC